MPGWMGRGERGVSLLGWAYGRCGIGLPTTSQNRGVHAVGHGEGRYGAVPSTGAVAKTPTLPATFVVNRLGHCILATLSP